MQHLAYVSLMLLILLTQGAQAAQNTLIEITYSENSGSRCIDQVNAVGAPMSEAACSAMREQKTRAQSGASTFTCQAGTVQEYRQSPRVYDQLCDKSIPKPPTGLIGHTLKKNMLIYFSQDGGTTIQSCIHAVRLIAPRDRSNPASCEIDRTYLESKYQRAFQNLSFEGDEIFELQCSPTKTQGEHRNEIAANGRWCTAEQLQEPRMAVDRVIEYYRHQNPDHNGGDDRAAGIDVAS